MRFRLHYSLDIADSPVTETEYFSIFTRLSPLVTEDMLLPWFETPPGLLYSLNVDDEELMVDIGQA